MSERQTFTKHGQERCSQRNISAVDLDVVRRVGTPVEGGLLVRVRDAMAYAKELERQAQRVRRLANTRVVFGGDEVVTVYRARPSKQKGLLRSADEGGLRD